MKKIRQRVPFWEWVMAGAGSLLLLFVLGALGREAITGAGPPPLIELRIKGTKPHGSGELVLIEARNLGGQVAVDLKVRGTLGGESNLLEQREVTIDYLPRRSRKVIGLFFSQPTGDQHLRLEPIGFVEP